MADTQAVPATGEGGRHSRGHRKLVVSQLNEIRGVGVGVGGLEAFMCLYPEEAAAAVAAPPATSRRCCSSCRGCGRTSLWFRKTGSDAGGGGAGG